MLEPRIATGARKVSSFPYPHPSLIDELHELSSKGNGEVGDRCKSRVDLTIHQLVGIVQQVNSQFAIDADTQFSNIGLDSIAAVELRAHLERATAMDLPVTLAIDTPTVRELWTSLMSTSVPRVSADHRLAPNAGSPKAASNMLSVPEILDVVKLVASGAELDADTQLSSIGLDSISMVELRAYLEAATNMDVPVTLAIDVSTVRELSASLSSIAPTVCENVWLRSPDTAAPWVFIPGIFGSVEATFKELLTFLDVGPGGAIGLEPPISSLSGCSSWHDLVAVYTNVVLKSSCAEIFHKHPNSMGENVDLHATESMSLKIVGYSFGCRIAYAVCDALLKKGYNVHLMLIDGPPCGPMGSLEESILKNMPASIPGQMISLLAKGGTTPLGKANIAVQLYVASESEVGLDIVATVDPKAEIVRATGTHQSILREPNVQRVATYLAQAARMPRLPLNE